jgi:hypothetical protein
MNTLGSLTRIVVIALVVAVAPLASAKAQYYASASPPPLYPYETHGSQPYAVQVAPNTYVIHRPGEEQHAARHYPYVRSTNVAAPKPGRFDRPHNPVDRGLIEELRKRHSKTERGETEQGADSERALRKPTHHVINTTRIVHDTPVVRETRRYVDDPPRVIERRQVIDDATGVIEPAPAPVQSEAQGRRRGEDKKRVIAADAEVTILGPDRMSIRLFRKGQGPKANARAD